MGCAEDFQRWKQFIETASSLNDIADLASSNPLEQFTTELLGLVQTMQTNSTDLQTAKKHCLELYETYSVELQNPFKQSMFTLMKNLNWSSLKPHPLEPMAKLLPPQTNDSNSVLKIKKLGIHYVSVVERLEEFVTLEKFDERSTNQKLCKEFKPTAHHLFENTSPSGKFQLGDIVNIAYPFISLDAAKYRPCLIVGIRGDRANMVMISNTTNPLTLQIEQDFLKSGTHQNPHQQKLIGSKIVLNSVFTLSQKKAYSPRIDSLVPRRLKEVQDLLKQHLLE